jgi:hypothetical protein
MDLAPFWQQLTDGHPPFGTPVDKVLTACQIPTPENATYLI